MYDPKHLKDMRSIIEKPRELEQPQTELNEELEGLDKMTDDELKLLLQEPRVSEPENQWMRDQIVDILRERHGAEYVRQLMRDTRVEDDSWQLYAVGRETWKDTDENDQQRYESPGHHLREVFKEYDCPLADVFPIHEVETFIIDPNGVFYVEMSAQIYIHLQEFELVFDQEISGWFEEIGLLTHMMGIWANMDVNGDKMGIDFLELWHENNLCVLKTNHPLCRYVSATVEQLFTVM